MPCPQHSATASSFTRISDQSHLASPLASPPGSISRHGHDAADYAYSGQPRRPASDPATHKAPVDTGFVQDAPERPPFMRPLPVAEGADIDCQLCERRLIFSTGPQPDIRHGAIDATTLSEPAHKAPIVKARSTPPSHSCDMPPKSLLTEQLALMFRVPNSTNRPPSTLQRPFPSARRRLAHTPRQP